MTGRSAILFGQKSLKSYVSSDEDVDDDQKSWDPSETFRDSKHALRSSVQDEAVTFLGATRFLPVTLDY